MSPILLFLAYLLSTLALEQAVGFSWPGLVLMLASLACAVAAIVYRGRFGGTPSEPMLRAGLGVLVFGSLFLGLIQAPGIYLSPKVSRLPFALATVGLAVVSADYYLNRLLPAAWRFPVALICFVGSGLWMLHATPAPFIDVWTMQTEAAHFLLSGLDPYSQLYQNIYGSTRYLAESLIVDGKIRSFPYPPVTLLLGTLGSLFGDVRVGTVFAIAATAYALRAIGRGLGLPAGHVYELIPLCIVCHPSALFLVEQAYTDVYLGLAAVLCIAGIALGSPLARALTLGLFLATKQYAVVWLPVLWARGHLDARSVLVGCAIAFATAVPFLLWDFPGFWHGVVSFQLEQVFRPGSLSIAAVLYRGLGVEIPRWFPLVTAVVISLWLARHRDRSLATTCVGGAVLYQCLFLTSPQSFLNYFWFSAVVLLLGTLLELCRIHRMSLLPPES